MQIRITLYVLILYGLQGHAASRGEYRILPKHMHFNVIGTIVLFDRFVVKNPVSNTYIKIHTQNCSTLCAKAGNICFEYHGLRIATL